MCYTLRVEVAFTTDALRQFKKLPKGVRPVLKEAIRTHLMEGDPTEPARNQFRLRRSSPFADYELRVGDWRVFYRVQQDEVVVTLIGRRRGSILIVEGEELHL